MLLGKKIVVVLPAYNAAATLEKTFEEIPHDIVDEVVHEAPGGAHRDFDLTARNLADAIRRHLAELVALPPDRLKALRYEKFRRMGAFVESTGREAAE